jgi:hypothetical protein
MLKNYSRIYFIIHKVSEKCDVAVTTINGDLFMRQSCQK